VTAIQPRRSEKQEEADCDALVKSMLGTVRRYSQPRASKQTAGIADREYCLFDIVLRWEVKAEDGRLTAEQHTLLCEDFKAGHVVGCGTVQDLHHALVALRGDRTHGRNVAFRLVQLWAARGLRRGRRKTVKSGAFKPYARGAA
jgi:hypothetical protein